MVSGLAVLKLEMGNFDPWVQGFHSPRVCRRAILLNRGHARPIWNRTRTGLDCPRVNSARANPDEPILVYADGINILPACQQPEGRARGWTPTSCLLIPLHRRHAGKPSELSWITPGPSRSNCVRKF